jgi:hypothetical protein
LLKFEISNNLQVERPKPNIDYEKIKEMKLIKQEEDKLKKEQEKRRIEAYKQMTQSTLTDYRKEIKPEETSKFQLHQQKRLSLS